MHSTRPMKTRLPCSWVWFSLRSLTSTGLWSGTMVELGWLSGTRLSTVLVKRKKSIKMVFLICDFFKTDCSRSDSGWTTRLPPFTPVSETVWSTSIPPFVWKRVRRRAAIWTERWRSERMWRTMEVGICLLFIETKTQKNICVTKKICVILFKQCKK